MNHSKLYTKTAVLAFQLILITLIRRGEIPYSVLLSHLMTGIRSLYDPANYQRVKLEASLCQTIKSQVDEKRNVNSIRYRTGTLGLACESIACCQRYIFDIY